MSMVSSLTASHHLSPTHIVFSTKNTLMADTASDPVKSHSSAKRVAVIGAGVSGLAAAYKLKSNGLSVTLLEADDRAGGKIRTVANNGFIWDEGANTMTESEVEVTRLINDLGLRDKQQLPLSQNKRYIARDGLPVLLPSDPVSMLNSNILSAKSKLQILLEPFSWKKRHNLKGYNEHAEESVGEFFGRHFGEEFVDYLIDPFVAGTSGGDPQSLSMRHTFPELWDIENRYGSILCGAVQSRLTPKKKQSVENKSSGEKRVRGSFSFKGGMQTLIDTICERLSKDELKLQCKVLSLSHSHEGQSNSWSLSCLSSKTIEEKPYDAVVVTAPLCNIKEMKILNGGSPFNLDFIPEVNYLPVSIVVTAFKKENVKRPLEGFGVLIPSKEQGLKTLGTLFSSMMFPDRAPSDQYLYTTFVGGSRNRQLAKASMAELKELVSSELHQLLGTKGEPSFMNLTYWSKAFPLYGRDYGSVKKAIEKMENDLPGFFYAGNHKDGLSVGKALASGYKAADLVTSYLGSKSNANQTH